MFQNRLLKERSRRLDRSRNCLFSQGYPFSVVNSSVRGEGGVKNASGLATQQFMADYAGGLSSLSCTTPNSKLL